MIWIVSPPSRRDRGNRKDVDSSYQAAPIENNNNNSKPAKPERQGGGGGGGGRGRQFDRHSGTGIQ